MGIYSSSMGMSLTAVTVVAILEVFMIVFSVVNEPMYGDYLWNYRAFYIVLLTAAIAYICLNVYVRNDIERRYVVLNVVNPLYATFFFAWSLGITYSDALIYNTVDAMVFMTFSMTVPLSFFLFPSVYAAIVVVADALMLYITAVVSGSLAPLVNLSIFFVFQLVLGISFLRLKMKLSERIVEEQENADIDILTGFSNRRVYDEDVKRLMQEPGQDNLVYISIDLNGLKEANDNFGHEAGDKLIVGAAQCIRQCFGEQGKLYRIGGDEFVALVSIDRDELEGVFEEYDKSLKTWSDNNGMVLSTARGYACRFNGSQRSIVELARVADERMYADKARYYREKGRDRRRYAPEELASEIG